MREPLYSISVLYELTTLVSCLVLLNVFIFLLLILYKCLKHKPYTIAINFLHTKESSIFTKKLGFQVFTYTHSESVMIVYVLNFENRDALLWNRSQFRDCLVELRIDSCKAITDKGIQVRTGLFNTRSPIRFCWARKSELVSYLLYTSSAQFLSIFNLCSLNLLNKLCWLINVTVS